MVQNLKDSLLGKAKISSCGNNYQMVQNLDIEENCCVLDFPGQVLIRPTWYQGTRRVVMGQYDARGQSF